MRTEQLPSTEDEDVFNFGPVYPQGAANPPRQSRTYRLRARLAEILHPDEIIAISPRRKKRDHR